MEKYKISSVDKQQVEIMRRDYRNMIPLAGEKDEVAEVHEINIPTKEEAERFMLSCLLG